MLGLISFSEALPVGNSGEFGFRPKDHLTAEDMLRHLSYRRGELHLHIDYLRGRMIKTTVRLRQDGTFELETVNRGLAALKWIEQLEAKDLDHADESPVPPPIPPRALN